MPNENKKTWKIDFICRFVIAWGRSWIRLLRKPCLHVKRIITVCRGIYLCVARDLCRLSLLIWKCCFWICCLLVFTVLLIITVVYRCLLTFVCGLAFFFLVICRFSLSFVLYTGTVNIIWLLVVAICFFVLLLAC